jgi:hypothetical protein
MSIRTVLLIGVGYVGFILFVARMLSHKWHPDGGEHDPETCDECQYWDESNEWMRGEDVKRFDYEDDEDYAYLMMLVLIAAVSLMGIAAWFIIT